MDHYNELLEATIQRLQTLKTQGVRYLQVSSDTLNLLGTPAVASRPVSRSTSPPASSLILPSASPQPAAKPQPSPIPVPADEKSRAMAELRERALVCQKCPNLVAARKNVVFGVGNINADLMFVGEAPGADEDLQGEPFVGRAGQLLTKIIQTMGFTRENVYIANILKCRPDTPGQSFGNRAPSPEEMERCLPYLHAQIDLIKPKVIVALGATAVDGLFGKVPGFGITKIRGTWREYRGTPVMPTYHPSYLLRPNPNNVKRETWEDMLKVLESLNLPISEKQKGYFKTTPAA
jgi:uracil-DNA glycosylase family 4